MGYSNKIMGKIWYAYDKYCVSRNIEDWIGYYVTLLLFHEVSFG